MKKLPLIMNLAVGLFAVAAQADRFDASALVRDSVSDLSRLSDEGLHAVAQEDGAQFYYAHPNIKGQCSVDALEIGRTHALKHHLRDLAEIQYQFTFSAAVDSLATDHTYWKELIH